MTRSRWILAAAVLGSGIVFLDSTVVNVALPRIGRDLPRSILGPLIGGLLVDTIAWRAAFFLNVPLVAVAAWATWKHVPESRDEQASSQFDWTGAAIVALAVGGLAFGTIYGQQRAWHDALGFVILGVGVVATIALPFWMMRAKHPLIPLELFRSRNFTVTNISTLVIYGALYVTFYYVGLFQQGTLGYAAAAAGAAGIPGSLFLIFLSRRFGSLAAKYGARIFMTVGPSIMALGLLWYVRVPATSTPWKLDPNNPGTYLPPASYFIDFLPGSIIFGVGLMIMVAPLTTA